MLISSYFIIMIILMLSSFSAYWCGKALLLNYFDDNNKAIINNIGEKFDEYIISNNDKIVNNILMDEDILRESLRENIDYSVYERLKTKLILFSMNNNSVDNLCVYLDNENIIVSTSGFATARQYYNAYFSDYFSDFESFEAFLKDKSRIGYKSYDVNNKGNLLFAENYITMDNMEYIGKIIIKNNYDSIISGFVSQDTNIVVMQGNEPIAYSDLTAINNINQESKKDYDGRFTAKSAIRNWDYYYIINMKKINGVPTIFTVLFGIIMLICIAICVAVSIIFIRYNYKPIKKFGDYIKRKLKSDDIIYSYYFFSDSMEAIEQEIGEQQDYFKSQEQLINAYDLSCWLLYGKMPEHPEKLIGKKLTNSFIIMAVCPDNYKNLFFDEEYNEMSVKHGTAMFILDNMLDEKLREYFDTVTRVKIDNMLVFILSFGKGAKWWKTVAMCCGNIADISVKEFNLTFKYFTSAEHDNIYDVPSAYEEVMTAMHSQENINSEKGNENEYHLSGMIKKFIVENIKKGNDGGVKEIMDKIFDDASVDMYSIRDIKAIVLEIYVISIKAADEIPIDEFIVLPFLEKISTYENKKSIIEAATDFTVNIAKIVRENDRQNNETIFNRVRHYIYKNYSNPALNTDMIADDMGISKDYLLSEFKKQSGMKMLDCIHQVRIEKASKILKSTNYTISEVAEMVGYSNAKTFTRAFIKLFGVTPGVYRGKMNES